MVTSCVPLVPLFCAVSVMPDPSKSGPRPLVPLQFDENATLNVLVLENRFVVLVTVMLTACVCHFASVISDEVKVTPLMVAVTAKEMLLGLLFCRFTTPKVSV